MSISSLRPERFSEYSAERQRRIAEASSARPALHPVNVVAKRLHPNRQYMKIAQVTQPAADAKCFRLVPDPARGTTECALFTAGQYVNVFLNIEGMEVNRAYSLSSSPCAALENYYELTIKYVEDGLVSRYILDNWKEGCEVEISGPAGYFTWNGIRDAKTVVGIAGGSGITPFLSMAQAIASGAQDFCLTLLYGSRKADGILFKAEFNALEAACDKIRVIHVLSDEEKEGYEHGFITADLIKKYAPADAPYSLFLCGPQAMYRFVDKEIETLGIAQKYVRHELFGEIHNPAQLPDYPGCDLPEVKITVTVRDMTRTVTGSVNDSVLQTLEKNGIAVPTRCRSGECGFCHSVLLSGKVYVPKSVDGRRMADFKYGGIHPCACFPLSDLEIEVPAAK